MVYKFLYVKNTEQLIQNLQMTTEQALEDQLYRRGKGIGEGFANNLFDAIVEHDVEAVRKLMLPVLGIEEVEVLNVVDKKGHIFHDYRENMPILGTPHPAQMLLLKTMQQNRQHHEYTEVGIHFFIPIANAEQVVGAVYLELSNAILSKNINAQYREIELIRQRDQDKLLIIQLILTFLFTSITSFSAWLFVRDLSKPINGLINELFNNDGDDEFVVVEGGARSDEIGLLTRAYNEMGMKVNKHTAAMQKMAYQDSLTQLSNRHKFVTHINQLMMRDDVHSIHLLFIDLDEFKIINDNFGHAIGDAMLITLAKRLDELVKFHRVLNSGKGSFEHNMVARIGGDEFLVALVNNNEEDPLLLGQLVLNSLHSYLMLAGHGLLSSGSVGMSSYPQFSSDTETLIKQADAAMYHAKSQGKNTCCLYSEAIEVDANRKTLIAQELKNAMDDLSQFELWYQPKVSIITQKLIGAEALIRWKHPTLGYIYPDQFIPIAEQSDLIINIGKALFLQLGEQLKQWQLADKIDDHFNVALNVSVRQIYRQDIVGILSQILADNDLSPHRIQLEVTESLLLFDKEVDKKMVNEVITNLQKIGTIIWLDDFGTGYSSLSYLLSFNFDGVKVDKTFIQDIETNKKNQDLVKAIISLAKTLGIGFVVEGIETEVQAKILQDFGYECGQGYLYAKPLTVTDFEEQWLC